LTKKPFTQNLAGGLAVRVYPDRRPGNLEIAGIHKALVLLRNGVEIVEEGAGFGLPIAKYRDKTFFPGSASLKILDSNPKVVVKTYTLDLISIKSLGDRRISDTLYHPIHGIFSLLYLRLGVLRGVFDSVIEMRNVLGVRTSFETTESRGEVEVHYTLYPDRIEIRAETRLLGDCEELIMLNEQGATTFRSYSDTHQTLKDGNIGAWDCVQDNEATLSNIDGTLSFTVERPQGSVLCRGRESIKGRLSWAGLALSFKIFHKISYTLRISEQSS
jgi:hypothetical protein